MTGVKPRDGLLYVELSSARRRATVDALALAQGNRTHAAKLLGVSVLTLRRYIKAFRLDIEDDPVCTTDS